MTGNALECFFAIPAWAAATSLDDRYQPDDIVKTEAFGKTRRWRCRRAHRPALARSPLRKAGAEFWELIS